jgi:hypothetical protein
MRNKKLGREVEQRIVTLRSQGWGATEIARSLRLRADVVQQVLDERLAQDDEPEIEYDPRMRRRLRSED